MNAKTKKQTIGLILREWYTIDSVLFNEHARKVIAGNKDFQEYVALKGALLENLYEYYMHVELDSQKPTPTDVHTLQEMASHDAKKAKATAAQLMNDPAAKDRIKSQLMTEMRSRNVKHSKKFTDFFIMERFKQYSLDNALIGIPLLEAKKLDAHGKSFKCKLLEESHKSYRDNLVALALSCKKNRKNG